MTQQLDFPDHIAHKPVFTVPFNAHDPHWEGDSEVQFLSIGWSQWDDEEPSAKIVRHSGKRWSRQSEEVPLARLIDLTSFVAMAVNEGDNFVQVPSGFFETQAKPVAVAYGSLRQRQMMKDCLAADQKLKARLGKLADLLSEMRADGKI